MCIDVHRITEPVEKLAALEDGLGDELWFLLGDCVEAGIDIAPIIRIIDASNLSKLSIDEQGNRFAKEDEHGKILKSPNFFPPEEKIAGEILRQLNK